MFKAKTPSEIEALAVGGQILSNAIMQTSKLLKVGVSTFELDSFFEQEISKHGALPAFKGYQDFPASLCISTNNEVVHGVPSTRTLKEGDIISLDGGVVYQGLYTDMSMSFSVGATSKEANRLILGTKEALNVGINAAKVGNYIGDISYAIQTVAQKYGFGIVRDLSGHGVGYAVHEEPSVYNFGKPKSGPAIVEGMVLAIEPMFTLGGADIRISRDKWTVVTADESLAAHWEHTIAIVDGLPKILTVALK